MTQFSLVRGRAMRVTKTNGCGAPVRGPKSTISTKGFISIGLSTNTVAADPVQVTNANGDLCINDTPPNKFQNYGVEIAFCGVDPELITMLTGQPLVMDSVTPTDPVGFRVNSQVDVSLVGFALEVWSVVPGGVCDPTGATNYGYVLFPFITGGQLGDFTFENGAVNFTLTGSTTKDGSGWGVGPYNVVKNVSGVASPLSSVITAGDHMHLQLTSVPPPNAVGGAVALGVPATGATAGVPATLTPANSYPPATLAAAQAPGAFIASPTSVWTTGQYVVLGDGSEAYWTGTAWAAGRKP